MMTSTRPVLDAATRALFFRYDCDLPLDPKTQTVQESEALRIERFEITSRHDERVPGLILSDPRVDGLRPTVLVGHPASLHKASDYILGPAADWVAQGAVCVTIDQAAHGDREQRPFDPRERWRYPARLGDEVIQTAVDWMRTLDYLATRPDIDAERVGFVGFSMGGIRGVPFVGLDPRVVAAVFCITAAAAGATARAAAERARQEARTAAITDPVHFAPLIAPRAVLMVAGRRDDVATPDRVQILYDALQEPREIVWLDCGHWDFLPQGLAPIWPFLEAHL